MSDPAAPDDVPGDIAPPVMSEPVPGDIAPPVVLPPVPENARVRSHPEIRTLLLTSEELTAWLLDQRTGEVRQLNQAAAAVWALIEEPVGLAALSADLAETFELEPSLADEVVRAAVDALRTEDLLELTAIDGSIIVDPVVKDGSTSGDEPSGDAPGDAPSGDEPGDEPGDAPGDAGSAADGSGEGGSGASRGESGGSSEQELPALLTRAPDP